MNTPNLRGLAVLALLALAPCARAVTTPITITLDPDSVYGNYHGSIILDIAGPFTGAGYGGGALIQDGVSVGITLMGSHPNEFWTYGSVGYDGELLRGGGGGNGIYVPGEPKDGFSRSMGWEPWTFTGGHFRPVLGAWTITAEWYLPHHWDGAHMTGTGFWSVKWRDQFPAPSPNVPEKANTALLMGIAVFAFAVWRKRL